MAVPEEVTRLALQLRRHLRRHLSMGIDGYPASPGLRRFIAGRRESGGGPPGKADGTSVPQAAGPAPSPRPVAESLAAVYSDVAACRACATAAGPATRAQTAGGGQPRLLVVGDWPRQAGTLQGAHLFGAEEDVMLWKMMDAIGLGREEVCVTNAVKCSPEPGQEMSAEQQQRCFDYLLREIAALRPRVILSMGEVASRQLLGVSTPLFRLRGRWHSFRHAEGVKIPVMPTFHPSLLLEHAELKRPVWQDLQLVKKRLTG